MHNDSTPHLNLPLPHLANLQEEDVPRLRDAITQIDTALVARESIANKGQPNGYAGLDSSGKVPAVQLPGYVDDVLEFSTLAAFPAVGEAGKIYVAIDTNKNYRWTGSAYLWNNPSPGSTDALTEGSTNLYFTAARVLSSVLTGLAAGANAVISATDTVKVALEKLQAQISGYKDAVLTFTNKTLTNPVINAFTGIGDGTVTGKMTAYCFTATNNGIPTNGMYLPAANTLGWGINSARAMSLDGNVLTLGSSTYAWGAYKGYDFGTGAVAATSGAQSMFATNAYYASGGTWAAKTTAINTLYLQSSGQHLFYTAPATTAGAAPSWVATMAVDTSGNLVATANVTAYSDERVKTNWRPLANDFVAKLSLVKHGIYDRTDTVEATTQVGVGAQSLQEVMPEAVHQTKKDDGTDGLLAVSYGNAALAACVELAKEVVSLRERLAKLESV